MKITSGLYSHMVMQRTRRNISRQPVCGTGAKEAEIYVRVEKKKKAIPGFAGIKAGRADRRGRFSIKINGVPAGGPYDVTLKAGEEEETFRDIFVGDVWILAGQSNMEGIGNLDGREKPSKNVRAFYMDERWDVAEDPIHVLAEATAPVHRIISPDLGRPKLKGVGSGVSFGVCLAKKHSIPQGLIPSAHGGTSMDQWKPGKGSSCLFGATVERVRMNGGTAAGLLWYQGESDAGPEMESAYTKKMVRLIQAFRREFGGIPVAIVQLSRVSGAPWNDRSGGTWMGIREQQRLLPGHIEKLAVVPAIDLPLEDPIHISAEGQKLLGKRLAEAIDYLRYSKKAGPAPIILQKVRSVRLKNVEGGVIEAAFGNVEGELHAPGRPNGFALSIGGVNNGHVYRVILEKNKAYILHNLPPADCGDASLSYGWELMPYCNITDKAGRSLPAFGPLPLGTAHPKTGFIGTMEASLLEEWPGDIAKAAYPKSRMTFTHAPLTQWYCPVAALRETNENRLVWFRYRFSAIEPMKLSLLFSYDGPVKVFLDQRAVFTDPHGCEPIGVDEQNIPVTVRAGKHELMIALGSNKGTALGISLRIARMDRKMTDPADKRKLPEPIYNGPAVP